MILYDFLHFYSLKLTKLTKFRAPKIAKKVILELLDSPKLISRQIWVAEKSRNFHTVQVLLPVQLVDFHLMNPWLQDNPVWCHVYIRFVHSAFKMSMITWKPFKHQGSSHTIPDHLQDTLGENIILQIGVIAPVPNRLKVF